MKIITNKNMFQSTTAFFNSFKKNEALLEGVSLSVVLTKDGIPIVITPYASNAANAQIIKTIQNTDLKDIKDFDIVTLEETFNNLKGSTKKVVIIFIPISTTPYAQNIELINKINRAQVDRLYEVIDKYPNLNIYLSTISHSIIYHIKARNPRNKIGVILTAYETNYIDVDFYIFSPEMLSIPILRQQLNFNKEAMISSSSCEDMMMIYNFFNVKSQEITNIFNNVSFITNYPIIFYKFLR